MSYQVLKNYIQHLRKLSDNGQLYVGYGSNLNAEDYKKFSGYKKPLEPVATGSIPDVELCFNKYASSRGGGVLSIRQRSGAITDAILFKADRQDWATLDAKEVGYTRIHVPVLVFCHETGRHEEIMAQTYVTTNPKGFVKPSAEKYLDIVLQGYDDHGLLTSGLKLAAEGKPNGFGQMNHNIFSYGTLCRGECRENMMQQPNLIQVGLAELAGGKLYESASGQYPCLVEETRGDEMQKSVRGDLWSYRADQKMPRNLPVFFERLDEIEGDFRPNLEALKEAAQDALQEGATVDEASMASRRMLEEAMQSSLFRRTLVDVDFGGKIRMAWVYFYNQPVAGLHEVPQNDWREYQGRWDSTFRRVLIDHSQRHGGFEQFRKKMASNWKTSVAASANSIEEVVGLLKSGALDERDLIIWCKPDDRKKRLPE